MLKASIIVSGTCTVFICLLLTVYVLNTLGTRGYHYVMGLIFEEVTPYMWAAMGVAICLTTSIAGSAMGIYTIGVSIVGAGVLVPRIRTRNLISIIFCEVVGIYGLIMAIFLVSATNEVTDAKVRIYNSHLTFGSGIIVGFVNFACGVSVGITGSGIALCDAANQNTFMKVLVAEIFASCLGIYGMICGVLLMSKEG